MGERESSFAHRLDKLISTMHPADRGPWTNEEVADGVRSVGGPSLSAAYVQQLRRGRRDNPSFALVVALARFYRVPVSYFSGGDADDALTEQELSLVNVARNPDLTAVVIKLDSLSPRARPIVDHLVDGLIELDPDRRRK